MLDERLSASRSLRTRRTCVALILPVSIASGGEFPVKELSIDGTIHEQHIDARITTSVATIVGAFPVSGRVSATHACDGTLTGAVSYSLFVRFAARLKGIQLVKAIEGRAIRPDSAGCVTPPETIRGEFLLGDSLVSGRVHVGDTTISIAGLVRAVANRGYHVEVGMAPPPSAPTIVVELLQQ